MAAATDPAQLTGLAGWVVDTIELLGPLGVGALVALDTVFPPVPSELVLPVAGLLAGQHRMSLVLAVVAATVGSLAGALLLHRAGASLGLRRLRRIADRLPLTEPEDVTRGKRWFDRHGGASVLVGRFLPVVRSLISIPAGVDRMPLLRFSVYTVIGSAVYNTVLVGAGYLLGSRWAQIGEYSEWFNYALYGACAIALVVFVRHRVARRRGPAREASATPSRASSRGDG